MTLNASELDPIELARFREWKAVQDEQQRTRGAYCLTPEGRAEIRKAWKGDDGSWLIVLLNEVERLETTQRKFGQLQEELFRRAESAEKDAVRLRKFAGLVMDSWPVGDVDGASLALYAIKCGLLTPTTRTEPCREEGCACAEYYTGDEFAAGIVCYRKTELLTGEKLATP